MWQTISGSLAGRNSFLGRSRGFFRAKPGPPALCLKICDRHQPNSIHDQPDGEAQLSHLTLMKALIRHFTNRDLRHGPFVMQLVFANILPFRKMLPNHASQSKQCGVIRVTE
jgi:hypothetical protein